MGLATKGFVKSQVNAVDSKYAELITSGTHRQGVWNAETNTPTLSPNSGTNGYWYDVSVEGDWDGRHWRVGDKIIFNSAINKWDQIPTGVEKDDAPMLIGFLNENSSFPTTRPSGKPLLVGDYLKVDSAAVLPFEIDDGTGTKILFDSYMDEAEWNGSRFQEKSYKAGMTNEIGVKNPEKESLSEEAVYQNQVNKEFKERLKNIGEFINVGNSFENVEKNVKYLYYLEEDWEEPDLHDDYFYFESNQDGSTVNWIGSPEGTMAYLSYSFDKENWTDWNEYDLHEPITLNQGEKVYIKNKNAGFSSDESFRFRATGSTNIGGNILSLIGYYKKHQELFRVFTSLFASATSIVSAEDLIIDFSDSVDGEYSHPGWFSYMFADCTDLVKAPREIRVRNISNQMLESMFSGCTSLTTAPELPITETVYSGGCSYMFTHCTSLITAPELPANTIYYGGYIGMFSGCTSLTTAPDLPAYALDDFAYSRMFEDCTSLTIAPELPAIIDREGSYHGVGCYAGMFINCISLTTAPELPTTILINECYDQMFRGCTSLTTAPELPATQLAYHCYSSMFYGCTSLNSIKLHYVGDFDVNYFDYWVNSVSPSGTLYYNGSDTTRGSSAIPEGWTVEQFSQNGGE